MRTFRSIHLWGTVAALALSPLLFGSVDRLSIAFWTIVLSTAMFCAVLIPMDVWQRRAICAFLGVSGAYAAVAIAQVIPDLLSRLNDPVWHQASELLGINLPSRISSRAEIPALAIGHFLLVVTSFTSGFFAGTSRRGFNLILASARYSILFYAIYGLLALVFTPNLLLWATKTAYRGSLTATFVNHNTAATFIGTGAILWLCKAFGTLQSVEVSSIRLLLLTPSNEHVGFRLILRSCAGLICLFALILTGSRGGLICSCLGLVIAIGVMVIGRVKNNIWYAFPGMILAIFVTFGWLTQAGRIGSLGLFDEGRWSVYGYCIEAIRQRPLLGTGVGTFADIFPALRGTDLSMWGTWDYAHSTALEVAVEAGLPLAILVYLAAVTSVGVLLRGAMMSKDRSQNDFAAATGVAILAYLHSLIDFSLQIPGFLIVFWIVLGCCMARSLAEEPVDQKTRSQRGFRPHDVGCQPHRRLIAPYRAVIASEVCRPISVNASRCVTVDQLAASCGRLEIRRGSLS